MNNVKELRRRAGMLQKEIAISVGVTRATVSEWETGRKNPTGDRLFKLAELFDVSTGVILGYEDVPSDTPIMFVDDGSPSVEKEILQTRELIRRDPERSILFSMATNADIQDVRRAIAIMEALKSTEEHAADTEVSE